MGRQSRTLTIAMLVLAMLVGTASAAGAEAAAQSGEGGVPAVYMTTDISPAGLMAAYEAMGWQPTGNVAVKLSTGEPAESDIHDIGILASTDPVAVDQASIDLVYAAEGNEALVRRIEAQNGLHTLEAAQQIGLGSRAYALVSLDD